MTEHIRNQMTSYFNALFSGQTDAAVSFFADDIEYTCYAPVNIFPHLGYRKGRPALADTIRALHARYHHMQHSVLQLIAEGDSVASIVDVRLRQPDSDRVVQIHLAHFTRFRDGLIVEHRMFLNTYDAIEQYLGHELDVAKLLDARDMKALGITA